MDAITGIWRLVESHAWDEQGKVLKAPYGAHPLGQIAFSDGRMLAALCNGGPVSALHGKRAYSSYGGFYTLAGDVLEVNVDVASDPSRIGGKQVRNVVLVNSERMLLRPPQRLYGQSLERRELVWERVWRPQE